MKPDPLSTVRSACPLPSQLLTLHPSNTVNFGDAAITLASQCATISSPCTLYPARVLNATTCIACSFVFDSVPCYVTSCSAHSFAPRSVMCLVCLTVHAWFPKDTRHYETPVMTLSSLTISSAVYRDAHHTRCRDSSDNNMVRDIDEFCNGLSSIQSHTMYWVNILHCWKVRLLDLNSIEG